MPEGGDGEEVEEQAPPEPRIILEKPAIEKGLSNLQRTPGRFHFHNFTFFTHLLFQTVFVLLVFSQEFLN